MTKPIEVEIYDQRYTVKADADAEYIKRVAAFVDEQMRAVAQGMKTATLSKLAVLAALNIAHQYLQIEDAREKGETNVERRLMSLMDSLDEQVPTSRLG